MTYYYSLKTKKEEHCLETRIGGDFDYAVYDLKQNLLKPKEIIKKEVIVEFLWNKQKELKAVFEKIEMKKAETGKSIDDLITEKINAGMKEGWTSKYEEKETVETGSTITNKTKVLLNGDSRNPVMKKDSEYVIVARLDLETNDVAMEVHSMPAKDMLSGTNQYNQIIDHLFLAILASLPDFIENHVCASLSKQTGISYTEAVQGYRAQKSLMIKTYSHISDMIGRALDIYKEQIKSHEKQS